jgi:cytosine/adenosine deaminase-related metal-dependent hydrolase
MHNPQFPQQRAIGVGPVTQALRMATVDGATLLNMSDRIGSLTVGKKADAIILDPGAVNFAPTFDAVSQVVLNAQPQNVEWVFVDGRALKRRGKLVGVDQDAIVRKGAGGRQSHSSVSFPVMRAVTDRCTRRRR